MRHSLFILLVTGLSAAFLGVESAQGQTEVPGVQNRGYYRSVHEGGVYMHTRGFGGYYRRGWRQTGFRNQIVAVELLSLRNPKEFKIGPQSQNTRGYFYGKINSVALLRPSYGWQKTLFDKTIKRGVRVSQYTLFGPTLALVKPVFVEVNTSIDNDQTSEVVRYSTDLDGPSILGRAPALRGIEHTRIIPGLHMRYGLNFDYGSNDSFIRAIETGATFDAFLKRIPIMDVAKNDQFYLTFYIAFHFGKRYL